MYISQALTTKLGTKRTSRNGPIILMEVVLLPNRHPRECGRHSRSSSVIPAKAGTQPLLTFTWIPAFAGMTTSGVEIMLVMHSFLLNVLFWTRIIWARLPLVTPMNTPRDAGKKMPRDSIGFGRK